MKKIILAAALVFVAGICNALIDVVDFAFERSIFSEINNPFWFKWFRSWAVDKSDNFFVRLFHLVDAWHFFKNVMLALLFGLLFIRFEKFEHRLHAYGMAALMFWFAHELFMHNIFLK